MVSLFPAAAVLLLILLPAVSFVSGVASLEIDPRTQPRRKWILVVLLILSLFGSVGASLSENRDKRVAQESAEGQRKSDQARIDSLLWSVQNLSGKADTILVTLRQRGFSPADLERVQRSQDADQARSALLNETRAANAQRPTTVLYFPKDVDGPKVVAALEQGGFSVRQQRQGEKNPTLATNAVWVGNDVTGDQAKFVALTLIRAGVEIRSLQRLKNGGGKRATLIEVGSGATIQRLRPLTAADVEKITNLPVGM